MEFPTTVYNRVAADFDPDYPKRVTSQEEFDKLGPGWFESPLEAAAWEPPKLNGPTFEEWTSKGYRAEAYPPHGYQAIDTPAFAQYKASVAEVLAARDAEQKAKDAAEVAAVEKSAAINVIDAKILKAMEANDGEEVARLEKEKASL